MQTIHAILGEFPEVMTMAHLESFHRSAPRQYVVVTKDSGSGKCPKAKDKFPLDNPIILN
jgi:hypothetical protein